MQPVEYLEGYADRLVRSFGRTKNRKISLDKQQRLAVLLSTYGIQTFRDIQLSVGGIQSHMDVQTADFTSINTVGVSATNLVPPDDVQTSADIQTAGLVSTKGVHSPADVQATNPAPITLEIGFGFGEHLWQLAQQNPQELYIGCETYLNGIANLAMLMEQCPVSNLRVYNGDARKLMVTMPEASIHQVFLLFPDPWPKNAHRKRRILNTAFCELLQRVLRPQGKFIFATDHPDYAQQLLQTMQHYPQFSLDANSKQNPFQEPAGWIPTRYQQKSLAGQPQFFIFTKE